MNRKKPKKIIFDLESYKDKNYLTHNFHAYPAKFVPQIPKIVIEEFTKKNDLVLDPFCGSGTTLIECKLNERRSIGIDTNPISVLVSKCKTTALTQKSLTEISKITEKIKSAYSTNQELQNSSISIPNIFNIDLWFQKNVQTELAIIKQELDGLNTGSVKNFLLTAFSAIINSVSNQASDTKYKSINKNITDGQTTKKFEDKVSSMKKRMEQYSSQASKASCIIHRTSALNMSKIKDSTVDLIVTSPPYANTYDYYLYHKHRMNWLGFDVKTPQSLEIGSRNKHSDNDMAINMYLESMEMCFKEFGRVLKNGRKFCIVVGDAIKDKKVINMNTEFNKIAEKTGFETLQVFSYDLRKYSSSFRWVSQGTDKKSHIMIFEK